MRIQCRVIVALLLLSFLLPGRAICEEKTLEKPLEKVSVLAAVRALTERATEVRTT